MRIDRDKNLLSILVNKQFEMTGIDYDLDRINKDGLIATGKKKEWWYNHYKFNNEEEYLQWRHWMDNELKEREYYEAEKEANYVDFRYGMTYKY